MDILTYQMHIMINNIHKYTDISVSQLRLLLNKINYKKSPCTTTKITAPIYVDRHNNHFLLLSNKTNTIFYALEIIYKFD